MEKTSYTLRPDQEKAVQVAVGFLTSSTRGQSLLLRSPTGSGKSYIEAEVMKWMGASHIQVVPSIEIAVGIAKKLDPGFDAWLNNVAATRRWTEAWGIYTAGRYRNLLLKGEVKLPKSLSFDEAHHTEASTYEQIWDLCGRVPRIGPTATTFRGTPEGTRELLKSWNDNVYTVISLEDSVAQGLIALPSFNVWPLLNDDLISIVNGEFSVRSVDSMAKDKMGDLVLRVAPFFDGTHYDRATMLAFSSIEQVRYAKALFDNAGLPSLVVTGDTTARQDVFNRVVDRTHILLQIKVVGEGVDLPLRRLIDMAPTMSPVAFMQRIGRIMRPTDVPPEYIACCHNLTRHLYLFHGLVPASSVRAAQKAWGEEFKPTRRGMGRAIGLEGFGRFLPAAVPLLGGLTGSIYGLQSKQGGDQWLVFLHPVVPTPLYFHRQNGWEDGKLNKYGGKKRKYVKWNLIQSMPEVEGCVSLAPAPSSPGQLYRWKESGARYGLDPDVPVNAKQYQLLPCLMDTGIKIKEQT